MMGKFNFIILGLIAVLLVSSVSAISAEVKIVAQATSSGTSLACGDSQNIFTASIDDTYYNTIGLQYLRFIYTRSDLSGEQICEATLSGVYYNSTGGTSVNYPVNISGIGNYTNIGANWNWRGTAICTMSITQTLTPVTYTLLGVQFRSGADGRVEVEARKNYACGLTSQPGCTVFISESSRSFDSSCSCNAITSTSSCTINNTKIKNWNIPAGCSAQVDMTPEGCDYCDPLWTAQYSSCTITDRVKMTGYATKHYVAGSGVSPNGSACCELTRNGLASTKYNHQGGSDCELPADEGTLVPCSQSPYLDSTAAGGYSNVKSDNRVSVSNYNILTTTSGGSDYGITPVAGDLDHDGQMEVVTALSGQINVYSVGNTGILSRESLKSVSFVGGPAIAGIDYNYGISQGTYTCNGATCTNSSPIYLVVPVSTGLNLYTEANSVLTLFRQVNLSVGLSVMNGSSVMCIMDDCYFVAHSASNIYIVRYDWNADIKYEDVSVMTGEYVGDDYNVPVYETQTDRILFKARSLSCGADLWGSVTSQFTAASSIQVGCSAGKIGGFASINNVTYYTYLDNLTLGGSQKSYNLIKTSSLAGGTTYSEQQLWSGVSDGCLSAPMKSTCHDTSGNPYDVAVVHYNGPATGSLSGDSDSYYGSASGNDGSDRWTDMSVDRTYSGHLSNFGQVYKSDNKFSTDISKYILSKTIAQSGDYGIFIADFNGDGANEVAVVTSTNGVTIYFYSKDMQTLYATYNSPYAPMSGGVYVGDHDGSGFQEILWVYTKSVPQTVYTMGVSLNPAKTSSLVRVNNVQVADGFWAGIGYYYTGLMTHQVWYQPQKMFVAVGGPYIGKIQYYGGSWVTSFNSMTGAGAGQVFYSLNVGDFNSDGSAEVLTAGNIPADINVRNLMNRLDGSSVWTQNAATGLKPGYWLYPVKVSGQKAFFSIHVNGPSSCGSGSYNVRMETRSASSGSLICSSDLTIPSSVNTYGVQVIPFDTNNGGNVLVQNSGGTGYCMATSLAQNMLINPDTCQNTTSSPIINFKTNPLSGGNDFSAMTVVDNSNGDFSDVYIMRQGNANNGNTSQHYDITTSGGSRYQFIPGQSGGRYLISDFNLDGYPDVLLYNIGSAKLYLRNTSGLGIVAPNSYSSSVDCFSGGMTALTATYGLSGISCPTNGQLPTSGDAGIWTGQGLVNFRTLPPSLAANTATSSLVGSIGIPVDWNSDGYMDWAVSNAYGMSAVLAKPLANKLVYFNGTPTVYKIQPCQVDSFGYATVTPWGKASGENNTKYEVTWGDSTSPVTQFYSNNAFSHKYTAVGTYNVKTRVCDNNGCYGYTNCSIVVNFTENDCSIGDDGQFNWNSAEDVGQHGWEYVGSSGRVYPSSGKAIITDQAFKKGITCPATRFGVEFAVPAILADSDVEIGLSKIGFFEFKDGNVLVDGNQLSPSVTYDVAISNYQILTNIYRIVVSTDDQKAYFYQDVTLIYTKSLDSTVISELMDMIAGTASFEYEMYVTGKGSGNLILDYFIFEGSSVLGGQSKPTPALLQKIKDAGMDASYIASCGVVPGTSSEVPQFSASMKANNVVASYPNIFNICSNKKGKAAGCDYSELKVLLAYQPACAKEIMNYCVAEAYPMDAGTGTIDTVQGTTVCAATLGVGYSFDKVAKPIMNVIWDLVVTNLVDLLLILVIIAVVIAIGLGRNKK